MEAFSQQLLEFFDCNPGSFDDAAHRGWFYRVVARDYENSLPIGENDVFALTLNRVANFLKGPHCIEVIDAWKSCHSRRLLQLLGRQLL